MKKTESEIGAFMRERRKAGQATKRKEYEKAMGLLDHVIANRERVVQIEFPAEGHVIIRSPGGGVLMQWWPSSYKVMGVDDKKSRPYDDHVNVIDEIKTLDKGLKEQA